MTRIICTCKTCKTNGVSAALVPDVLAASIGRTAKGRHGLVHMAHDPNAITGGAARARTGVQPA